MDIATDNLQHEREIDLRAIGARLWAKRWWIVIAMVLSTAGFAAVAFLSTPMYRAKTEVVVAENSGRNAGGMSGAMGELGGLAQLAGMDISGGAAQWSEPMAVIKSREFTERFLQDYNLLPEFFPKLWDAQAKHWKGAPQSWPNLARGFKYFDKKVRNVERDKITSLIKIEIEWRNPVEAAAWANELVRRLNAEMRARAIASANASIGYLQQQLATTTDVDARMAISHVLEAQINQRMLATVTDEYAFRVVDRALPPDHKDVVWPLKALLLLLGPVFGLLCGIFVVLVAGAVRGSHR